MHDYREAGPLVCSLAKRRVVHPLEIDELSEVKASGVAQYPRHRQMIGTAHDDRHLAERDDYFPDPVAKRLTQYAGECFGAAHRAIVLVGRGFFCSLVVREISA